MTYSEIPKNLWLSSQISLFQLSCYLYGFCPCAHAVKNKVANQTPQVGRETTSMRKQASATFTLKSWDEKTYNEMEGAPKLTRVSAAKSYQGDIEGEGKLEYLMMY